MASTTRTTTWSTARGTTGCAAVRYINAGCTTRYTARSTTGRAAATTARCCPGPCPPSCPPQGCPMVSCMPFAQVLISKPPPILAPTRPQPVVPLRLPCQPSNKPRQMTEEEALRWRYSNFYNNYNIDWHADGPGCKKPDVKCRAPPGSFTVTGENPCCSRPSSAPQPCGEDYCPTGFKTCTMRLTPPPCCDPCGTWTAQIQKCPPKPRKKLLQLPYIPCNVKGC